MNYHWKKGKKENAEAASARKTGSPCVIEIMTQEEFRKAEPEISRRVFPGNAINRNRFCHADRLRGAVAGIFAVPSKRDPSADKLVFGYCVKENQLIFIENEKRVQELLNAMEEEQLTDASQALLVLFDLMEYLLKDDVFFLQEYDGKLTALEERLISGEAGDFDRAILEIRKDLSYLSSYYEQMSDMGDTLQQAAAEEGWERGRDLFGLCSDRAGRLYSTVRMLKEYSMQLREMHQTQVDIRQNQIMKVLTIVTTVSTPVTLITGWYGMNFINMPELEWEHGYAAVILISAAVVLLELCIFRIKKWFH